jgi:hypothetical protein
MNKSGDGKLGTMIKNQLKDLVSLQRWLCDLDESAHFIPEMSLPPFVKKRIEAYKNGEAIVETYDTDEVREHIEKHLREAPFDTQTLIIWLANFLVITGKSHLLKLGMQIIIEREILRSLEPSVDEVKSCPDHEINCECIIKLDENAETNNNRNKDLNSKPASFPQRTGGALNRVLSSLPTSENTAGKKEQSQSQTLPIAEPQQSASQKRDKRRRRKNGRKQKDSGQNSVPTVGPKGTPLPS